MNSVHKYHFETGYSTLIFILASGAGVVILVYLTEVQAVSPCDYCQCAELEIALG